MRTVAVSVDNDPRLLAALGDRAENLGYLCTAPWISHCYLYLSKSGSTSRGPGGAAASRSLAKQPNPHNTLQDLQSPSSSSIVSASSSETFLDSQQHSVQGQQDQQHVVNRTAEAMYIFEDAAVPSVNWAISETHNTAVPVGEDRDDNDTLSPASAIEATVAQGSYLRLLVDKIPNVWTLRQKTVIQGSVYTRDAVTIRVGLLSVGSTARSIVVEAETSSDTAEAYLEIKRTLYSFLCGCIDETRVANLFAPKSPEGVRRLTDAVAYRGNDNHIGRTGSGGAADLEGKTFSSAVPAMSLGEYLQLDDDALLEEFRTARLGGTRGGFNRMHQAFQLYKLVKVATR